jgi:hypothetical protein
MCCFVVLHVSRQVGWKEVQQMMRRDVRYLVKAVWVFVRCFFLQFFFLGFLATRARTGHGFRETRDRSRSRFGLSDTAASTRELGLQ